MPGVRKLWPLAAVALVVLAGLLAIGSSSTNAVGPDILPFSVTNNSGRAEEVHLYLVGAETTSGRLGSVNAVGNFAPWPEGTNPPMAAPDVSFPGPANGEVVTVGIPKNFSGRMYMAFGQKLYFALTPDGLIQPAPWTDGDPNQDILFDWSELTYVDEGIYLNSSQVDMFAVPHAVTAASADGGVYTTGEVVANGRNRIIEAFRADPLWADSVVTAADGSVLRVLSPSKAGAGTILGETYFDPYVDQVWDFYIGRTLVVQPFGDKPNTLYYGTTVGNRLRFIDGTGDEVASFDKPTTSDVWGCDGELAAPDDFVVGPIARILCAGFHRSTLGVIDDQPGGGPDDFYQGDIANHYSRIIHHNMVDGKAYGFALDDVQSQEPMVHATNPVSAGVVLSPFDGPEEPAAAELERVVVLPAIPPATEPEPPASEPVTIKSRLNGKCIDVPGSRFRDGENLIMFTCHGEANQTWQFLDGTVQAQEGLCMAATDGGVDDGTRIELADCDGSPGQQFELTVAGDLINTGSAKCVDVREFNVENYAEVQIWGCAGSPNQRWDVE